MFKIADITKYIEISYLYVHKAAVFVLNPKSITPDHNCLSGCFCSWISLLAWSSEFFVL